MKYEVYKEFSVTDDFNVFDFVSAGKNGGFIKRIVFTPTDIDGIYNLAFGDVDVNNEIDDFAVTGNGDRNKVLATIAFIVDLYTRKFPDRWIRFRGSTEERTRLYRMAIGLHLEELSNSYDIFDYDGSQLTPFRKNMKIKTFLIKRKKM